MSGGLVHRLRKVAPLYEIFTIDEGLSRLFRV